MAASPKPKSPDRRDWSEYNAILIARGELRPLLQIVKNWADLLEHDNEAKEGHFFSYPNALFDLFGKVYYETTRGFRYLEGLGSFLGEILHFPAPSYSTIRRRIYTLDMPAILPRNPKEANTPKDLAIDSTGYKLKGPGEYLHHKHHPTTRREFEKSHTVVDVETHEILSHQTTNGYAADSPELEKLVSRAVKIQKGDHLYGDKGYGGHKDYQVCIDNHLNPVFPPKSNARTRSRGGPLLRSARIWEYKKIGHDAWKAKYGYGKRCAVEQVYAYKKQLFGSHMRATDPTNFSQEEGLKVTYFNRYMRDLHRQ